MTTDEKVDKLAKAVLSLVEFLHGTRGSSSVVRTVDDETDITLIEHTLREIVASHQVGGE